MSLFHRPPLLHVAHDEGSGPLVVLIHGVASSSITFQNVLPLLTPTHRCVAIDLLGFGESPVPPDCEYTLEDHVQAVAQTVKSLKFKEPFALVGHSMGGLIAPRYAATHPKLVNKLVLVSPPIYTQPEALADRRDRRVQDLYLKAYKFVRENRDFTLRNGRIVAELLPIKRAMDINERTWEPFVKSLEHTIESQTTISDLAALDVPVEIVYGSRDEFASPGGIRIAEKLRGVHVSKVRGADHLISPRLATAVAAAVDADHEA